MIPLILILHIPLDLTHESPFDVAVVVFMRIVLCMGAKESVCVCLRACACVRIWFVKCKDD